MTPRLWRSVPSGTEEERVLVEPAHDAYAVLIPDLRAQRVAQAISFDERRSRCPASRWCWREVGGPAWIPRRRLLRDQAGVHGLWEADFERQSTALDRQGV
jgi:hypothetical protein